MIISALVTRVEHVREHGHIFVGCCYCLVTRQCPSLLPPHRLQPARLLCPWDFPGKSTGVGSRFLLQGIFLTQGSNLCLPVSFALQVDSLPLSDLGSLNVCAATENSPNPGPGEKSTHYPGERKKPVGLSRRMSRMG